MINGSFGSGKTSTSQKLQPLIPNSMIYDPEKMFIHRATLVPAEVMGEFKEKNQNQ